MKKGFVQTENFRRLKEAEKMVAKRGAREAGLVIVRGVYGIGKSELTERWATDSGYLFVRAKETWTVRSMLDELADKMGLPRTGNAKDVQARIIGKLAVDMVPMIFDEADHLIRQGGRGSAAMLEVIRDITDLTGTMCFLVGMEHFPIAVARHGHIASRVAKVVELDTLSLADVQATVTVKAEISMDASVVASIHQQSAGRMRLVLNAIANIEQWAQANDWGSAVTGAHIANRPLCVEFNGKALGRRPGAV